MKEFKTYLLLFGLAFISLLQSCNLDKSKVIGTWNISYFNINGESIEKKYGYRYDEYKAKTIQFLENGFFILNIEMTTSYPADRFFKAFTHVDNLPYKGKWELKSFSKIEFQFIDSNTFDIGLQKGSYEFDGNSFVVKAKSDQNFSSLNLYKEHQL